MKDDSRLVLQHSPSLIAAPLLKSGSGAVSELLSVDQQRALSDVSRLMVLRPHTVIYAQGSETTHVFNVVSGVAQTYRLTRDGGRRITAFVYPGDLIGLSENGLYIDTAQALNAVVGYKIPVDRLPDVIAANEGLDLAFLSKISHDLRRVQRHAIALSHKDASTRLAIFLCWLRADHRGTGRLDNDLTLPMMRHDIADYMGLSVESVSRAFKALEDSGAIQRRGSRGVIINDPALLERLAGGV